MRRMPILNKVEEAATSLAQLNHQHAINLPAAERLEQYFELRLGGQAYQSFQQLGARMVGSNLEFFPAGFAPDAVQKQAPLLIIGELVQLEHLIGSLEVSLLFLVQQPVEVRLYNASGVLVVLFVLDVDGLVQSDVDIVDWFAISLSFRWIVLFFKLLALPFLLFTPTALFVFSRHYDLLVESSKSGETNFSGIVSGFEV